MRDVFRLAGHEKAAMQAWVGREGERRNDRIGEKERRREGEW